MNNTAAKTELTEILIKLKGIIKGSKRSITAEVGTPINNGVMKMFATPITAVAHRIPAASAAIIPFKVPHFR